MAGVGEFREPVRAVLAVEVRGGEVETPRFAALEVERQQERVVRAVELRERVARLRQPLEKDVSVGHRTADAGRARIAVEGRERRTGRHAHRTPAPEEIPFGVDKPPLPVDLLRIEPSRRPLLRALRPAAVAIAVRRAGMRRKVGFLFTDRRAQLRLGMRLPRPLPPLELAELVEAGQKIARLHLRPGFVRDGHLDQQAFPRPAAHFLVRTVKRVDDLDRRHLLPNGLARHQIRIRDQDGRSRERNPLQDGACALPDDVRRRHAPDLARLRIHPDRDVKIESVENDIARLVAGMRLRVFPRVPQGVDLPRLALVCRARHLTPVHGLF